MEFEPKNEAEQELPTRQKFNTGYSQYRRLLMGTCTDFMAAYEEIGCVSASNPEELRG